MVTVTFVKDQRVFRMGQLGLILCVGHSGMAVGEPTERHVGAGEKGSPHGQRRQRPACRPPAGRLSGPPPEQEALPEGEL